MDEATTEFMAQLRELGTTLTEYVSTNGGDWSIKGFIDVDQNIYTISADTKIISKILEIQLFPKFLEFADAAGYDLVLAEHQNWYPDISFVKKSDPSVKFAVDIKTTYRLSEYKDFCNGFTLGSHGAYFRDRASTKNIQFPYKDYNAHISLGILYTRALSDDIDETEVRDLSELTSITSVITDLLFFVEEKWKIASDRSGSGNTANIGSISYIPDVLAGNGAFANLGEDVFDEYWINQGVLQVPDPKNPKKFKNLTKLSEYLEFKGMDANLINRPKPRRKAK
ncbi:type-2 restriction enzyme EcoRV (plasmid) [Antarctobacter heliothermus]|uniref:Type-2 restriction enzyme EcoRV n=1 Tax=Antarctobacter heliothermus TaxID=74033 RepID=A0A222EAQ4_9RHOB|nr:EcoRV family type II restriction endonuclease [Antarctobacter heliothermus]ASP23180.1 type-2 restriction enzyme EcoRV [Antarctobacter heliothermus]